MTHLLYLQAHACREHDERSLSTSEIETINRLLAKELIETRLDIAPTEDNVERLATCIAELETGY